LLLLSLLLVLAVSDLAPARVALTLSLNFLADDWSWCPARPVDHVGGRYELTGPSRRLRRLAHVQQDIATMARVHREDRCNRSTDNVERILGRPAQSVAGYVAEHHDLFD
jgi:hypothetical protein